MQVRLRAALLILSCGADAQTTNTEPIAVLELGGADSWNIRDGSSTGGDVPVEFTPIENWLEMEVGTTPVFAPHTVEWDTDLLF
ncbi:MAG: hypothetical protein JO217_06080 [Acidobacteriaceae bacterium]|nr:hypothetical protein [Acidobacteriaceae bacterium]